MDFLGGKNNKQRRQRQKIRQKKNLNKKKLFMMVVRCAVCSLTLSHRWQTRLPSTPGPTTRRSRRQDCNFCDSEAAATTRRPRRPGDGRGATLGCSFLRDDADEDGGVAALGNEEEYLFFAVEIVLQGQRTSQRAAVAMPQLSMPYRSSSGWCRALRRDGRKVMRRKGTSNA